MRAQFRQSTPIAQQQAAIRASVWMVLLALCVPAAGAASLPHPHRQPKQIVRIIARLERQWQMAELHADTTVMAGMLSDDYLGIYGDGTLATKAETIANAKSGATHFTEINTSDRKIHVFGKTAVVVSKAEVVGTNDGEDISGHYRYTRVYHRTNGVWKIINFEASSIHEHIHSH